MINTRVVAKIADGVIRGWLLIERKMKLEAIHDITPLQGCITPRCTLKVSIVPYSLFAIWVFFKGKGEVIV